MFFEPNTVYGTRILKELFYVESKNERNIIKLKFAEDQIMIIKAVKFRKDGFYTQPFVFGGEEGAEKFNKA